MAGDVWNLVAAILCTIGGATCTAALVSLARSMPTRVNVVAAIGTGIGTLGGVAWIIAAAYSLGPGH